MPPGKLIFYDGAVMGVLLLIVLIEILLPDKWGGRYIRMVDLKVTFFLVFIVYILWKSYVK